MNMNSYGFDLEPYTNGGYYDQSQGGSASQQSQPAYHQQLNSTTAITAAGPGPYYESYDPAQTSPTCAPANTQFLGIGGNSGNVQQLQYNSSGRHHILLQPSLVPATSNSNNSSSGGEKRNTGTTSLHPCSLDLEPDPIANSVEMRHQGWPIGVSNGNNRSNGSSCHTYLAANSQLEQDSPYNSFFQDALDHLVDYTPSPGDMWPSVPARQPQPQPTLTSQANSPPLYDHKKHKHHRHQPQRSSSPENNEPWLAELQIEVSGVALKPMTGREVLSRVQNRTTDVIIRYLPCVDFLVACQQELRAGLAAATQKRLYRQEYRNCMTPRQFYNRYLQPLSDRFIRKNQQLMGAAILNEAVLEIQNLCNDARKVEYQGCEAMKNAFLGGMKEGVSWGLRKWLSKNGGALHICNDLECILTACRKLDRNADTTQKLSERLRPLAKQALDRLKNDVPSSYQEQSTAHPYLPFFHRLECALKGMSSFDPDDDDVICIDDEDDSNHVKAANPPCKKSSNSGSADANFNSATNKRKVNSGKDGSKKRKKNCSSSCGITLRSGFGETVEELTLGNSIRDEPLDFVNSGDADGNDSDIEVVEIKSKSQSSKRNQSNTPTHQRYSCRPLLKAGSRRNSISQNKELMRCSRCTMLNTSGSSRCCMCDQVFNDTTSYDVMDENDDSTEEFSAFVAEMNAEMNAEMTFDEAAATIKADTSVFWDTPDDTSTKKALTHETRTSTASARASESSVENETHTSVNDMTHRLESLANMFDVNKHHM